MGGVQKALLRAPDTGEALIARLVRLGREAGHDLVLLGAADIGAAVSGVPQLPDAAEIGPLAALQSLLAYAGERDALCLACDMPFVTAELLAKLASESCARENDCVVPSHVPQGTESTCARDGSASRVVSGGVAQVVAARDQASGKWEAMFARYVSPAVAPLLERALADGERSFQELFTRLTVRELLLDPRERNQLRDWDTPEDMRTQR